MKIKILYFEINGILYFQVSNLSSLARRMSSTSTQKLKDHGLQPQVLPWLSHSFMTPQGLSTESSPWRAPRRSSTPPSHPTWHSQKQVKSLDSGQTFGQTQFMVSVSARSRSSINLLRNLMKSKKPQLVSVPKREKVTEVAVEERQQLPPMHLRWREDVVTNTMIT